MLIVVSAVLSLGCQPANQSQLADAHDHGDGHDHVSSYDQMVAELEEQGDAVRQAFEADEPEAAHDPLHEVAHLLEHLEEHAKALAASDPDREELMQAIDQLFNAFGKLDLMFHGGEKVAYADVSEAIDENMAVLKSKIESVESAVHDHEDEDHDH